MRCICVEFVNSHHHSLKNMSGEVEAMEQQDIQIQDGVENGNLFSAESSENVPVKEDRVFRKAKRTIKRSPSKEDGVVKAGMPSSQVKGLAALSKNSRKSRNGLGRGQPKKGTKHHLLKLQ